MSVAPLDAVQLQASFPGAVSLTRKQCDDLDMVSPSRLYSAHEALCFTHASSLCASSTLDS